MTGNAPTHTCSYFCDKPECIKAQRDELREKLAALESGTDAPVGFIARGNSSGDVWFEWAQNSTVNTLDKIIPLGKSVPVFLSSAKLEVKSLEKHCSFHGGYGLKKNCIDCNTALEKPVPVEPECITKMRRLPKGAAYEVEHKTLDYIDTLQSALKLAQEERDIEAANGKHWAEAYRKWANTDQTRKELLLAIERAEKAEEVLIQHYCDYDFTPTFEQATEMMLAERKEKKDVEEKYRRMVELLKEPSEAMWSAVWVSIKVLPLQRTKSVLNTHNLRLLWAAFHQAMSAKLLKKVEK